MTIDPDVSRHEGLTIRALDHGGYLVTHPDIYTVKALYFASTTIEEAFAFIKRTFDELAAPQPLTAGK